MKRLLCLAAALYLALAGAAAQAETFAVFYEGTGESEGYGLLVTEDGEALRHDDEFLYVGAWQWGGEGGKPVLHREPLVYNAIKLVERSYK